MARLKGSRNKDYPERRHALALTLAAGLVDDAGRPRSVKELANQAGVAVPTLLHYFADHEGMVRAALEAVGVEGAPRAALIEVLVKRPAPVALRLFADNVVTAFRRYGLGHLFASGLVFGLGHPSLGPVVLAQLLEPTLQHAERLVTGLQERGELAVTDVRAFALTLVAPLVLALLHQDSLGGRQHRPLDLEAYVEAHLEVLLKGVSVAAGRRRRP